MERYSILDLTARPAPMEGGLVGRSFEWRSCERLHFPGDDGGESLARWARRDLEATLQLLADRAQYITGASGAAIALRDGEHIICCASSGPAAPEVGSCLEVSSGLSGESVRTRKILRCDDASTDPRVNYESCCRLGISSLLVMPLFRNEEVMGIFEVFGSQPHSFQEHDVLALERMGEMVNTALDNAKNTCRRPVLAGMALPSRLVDKQDLSPCGPLITPQQAQKEKLAYEGQGLPPASRSEGAGDEADPSAIEDTPSHRGEALLEEGLSAEEIGSKIEPSPVASLIRGCSACGFPISEGRVLCLDCEKSVPENSFASTRPNSTNRGLFLAGLIAEESQPSGIKHWIVVHKYLIGTVLVMGSTIALLLLR